MWTAEERVLEGKEWGCRGKFENNEECRDGAVPARGASRDLAITGAAGKGTEQTGESLNRV